MKKTTGSYLRLTLWQCALLIALISPAAARADTWQLQVGAQSGDKAHQAFAFLPNEIWIHAGDSITWNFVADDLHTVTFLIPGQVRPAFQVGCPGTTPDGSPVTGSNCVNSGVLVNGNTYNATFPAVGNFKLVCLVHSMMTATIHVLDPAAILPHDQAFYDQQARRERESLLSDLLASSHTMTDMNVVAAGAGKVIATGGGTATASVMRFMDSRKVIRVGETVEWVNTEAATNHTVTFGPEPANLVPPSANVFTDPDGARHAIIRSPSDTVHSGFLSAARQDATGQPQTTPGVTRFRVTFTAPGVYRYICSLHDDVGMVGEIVVQP